MNLDFLQHYRPQVNVVERPHAHAGGKATRITGHHEIHDSAARRGADREWTLDGRDPQPEPFWTWTDLGVLLGMGIPAFILTFWLSAQTLRPLLTNKARLLMVPQFLGQAAMLVPFAFLCRWKYDRPLLPALRLGAQWRDSLRSFPMGFGARDRGSGVALRFCARMMFRSPMQDLMNDPRSAPLGGTLCGLDWTAVRGNLLSRSVAAC